MEISAVCTSVFTTVPLLAVNIEFTALGVGSPAKLISCTVLYWPIATSISEFLIDLLQISFTVFWSVRHAQNLLSICSTAQMLNS